MIVKLMTFEECHKNILKLLEQWVEEGYFIKVNGAYIKKEN